MAIRVEHQPSGAAVGMAAYAAGLNKARKKQQKAMLDMWLDEQKEATRQRKTVGNRYRNAMAGGGRVTGSQRPVIGMSDPLAEADGEDAVRIRSQRRANARARRLGRAAPYPDAEVRPIPGKTQDEIKREWELEDQKRKWKWQEDREADKREQETEDQVRDRTFKGLEGSFNQLNDWMFGVDRNALNDTGAKAYNDLMTYIAEGWKKVQSGESQQTDFYSAAIEEITDFRKNSGMYMSEGAADDGPTYSEDGKWVKPGDWEPNPDAQQKPEVPYAEQVAAVTKQREQVLPAVLRDLDYPPDKPLSPEKQAKVNEALDQIAPYPPLPQAGAAGATNQPAADQSAVDSPPDAQAPGVADGPVQPATEPESGGIPEPPGMLDPEQLATEPESGLKFDGETGEVVRTKPTRPPARAEASPEGSVPIGSTGFRPPEGFEESEPKPAAPPTQESSPPAESKAAPPATRPQYGKPMTPPKGRTDAEKRAIQNMLSKGYEYSRKLNARGEEVGKPGWHPREGLEPNQVVPYGQYQQGKISAEQAEQIAASNKRFEVTGPETSVAGGQINAAQQTVIPKIRAAAAKGDPKAKAALEELRRRGVL